MIHGVLSTVTCDMKYVAFPNQKHPSTQLGAAEEAISTELQHQQE